MAASNYKNLGPTTSTRIGKFAIIGAILALCNFAVYTFLARVVFNSNELLWLDSIISYALATILAYILHSKITWKERPVTKRGIFMFFIWNGIAAFLISPFFTWLFGFIKPVYEFVYNILFALHLPLDYNFIESTGIFGLTTCITMILNYLFYNKLVFCNQTKQLDYRYDKSLEKYKVSVIVPIYNTEKYLPDCIDSILKQTHKNLEVILIDDGSTDNSSKIADEYAKKDTRVKAIHQKNQGQSIARNTGLKKSTGEFISFVDADDKTKPTFIADLLAPFINDTVALSICGIHYKRIKSRTTENVYINPIRARHQKEELKTYILYLLAIDGRMYSSVNKLYRANIAKKLDFDARINFAEDTKFVLDYIDKIGSGEFAFILKPLYIYNFGTETSTMRSASTDWHNWQNSYTNLKSWLGHKPSIKSKFWLHVIRLRWRISYCRSKKRAKL